MQTEAETIGLIYYVGTMMLSGTGLLSLLVVIVASKFRLSRIFRFIKQSDTMSLSDFIGEMPTPDYYFRPHDEEIRKKLEEGVGIAIVGVRHSGRSRAVYEALKAVGHPNRVVFFMKAPRRQAVMPPQRWDLQSFMAGLVEVVPLRLLVRVRCFLGGGWGAIPLIFVEGMSGHIDEDSQDLLQMLARDNLQIVGTDANSTTSSEDDQDAFRRAICGHIVWIPELSEGQIEAVSKHLKLIQVERWLEVPRTIGGMILKEIRIRRQADTLAGDELAVWAASWNLVAAGLSFGRTSILASDLELLVRTRQQTLKLDGVMRGLHSRGLIYLSGGEVRLIALEGQDGTSNAFAITGKLIEELGDIFSGDRDAMWRIGRAALDGKFHREAFVVFQAIFTTWREPAALLMSGRAEASCGRFSEAKLLAQQCIKLATPVSLRKNARVFARASCALAYFLRSENKSCMSPGVAQEILSCYEGARGAWPEYLIPLHGIASFNYHLAEMEGADEIRRVLYSRAADAFSRARDIERGLNPTTNLNLLKSLSRAGRSADASRLAQELLSKEMMPELEANVRKEFAGNLIEEKAFQRAAKEASAALALQPGMTEAWNSLLFAELMAMSRLTSEGVKAVVKSLLRAMESGDPRKLTSIFRSSGIGWFRRRIEQGEFKDASDLAAQIIVWNQGQPNGSGPISAKDIKDYIDRKYPNSSALDGYRRVFNGI